MQELNFTEIENVSGGDAGATRQPRQNSWGEYPGDPLDCLVDYLMRMQ